MALRPVVFFPGIGYMYLVDRFFGRLTDLLRSLFRDADPEGPHLGRSARGPIDPDLQEAWEELDEYLRAGRAPRRERHQEREPRREFHRGQARDRQTGPARPAPIPESLRQDYTNLQVSFGAPFAEVKRAYKRLLHQYHPDRFSGDPEKQRVATRITQTITASFRRIRQAVEKTEKRENR
jgi:hypothetical protein